MSPDISMCLNKLCPSRENCYRFMATPTPNWQSYMAFKCSSRTGKCEYFWSLDKQNKIVARRKRK